MKRLFFVFITERKDVKWQKKIREKYFQNSER